MVFSPEGENFVKLSYIILDIGAKYLRKFFKEKWDEKYPTRKWNSDNESGEYLHSSLTRRVTRAIHMQVYVEKWKTGKERDWDTTTLMKVLLNSGLNLIDDFCSKQLDVIRSIRNEYFAHLPSMSCLYDEFVEVLTKFKTAANVLFGEEAKNEINEIENSPLGDKIADQVQKRLQNVIKDFEKDLTGKPS